MLVVGDLWIRGLLLVISWFVVCMIILFWLKILKQILKFLNLKLMIESICLSTKISLAKVMPKIGQEKNLLLILWWKLIHRLIKLKGLKREKIIASFHENDLLLSILSMSNYPEPYSHTRDSSIVLVKITKSLKDN